MTFMQYIDNPMGKKNAVFSQREQAKAMYTEKYDAVIVRESGHFVYQTFKDKQADEYYCYIKVPSESLVGFYYDVVIKFYTDDNALRTVHSLAGYDVKFFSNDPAFVYTYARVFDKLGLFIPELKSKGSKKALQNDPVERNMFQVPGYVKSIYFAFLYMRYHNLFLKANYQVPYSKSKLNSLVMDTERKVAERTEVGRSQALAKRKQRENIDKAKQQERKSPFIKSIGAPQTVRRIANSSNTKKIMRSNAIKKINKR